MRKKYEKICPLSNFFAWNSCASPHTLAECQVAHLIQKFLNLHLYSTSIKTYLWSCCPLATQILQPIMNTIWVCRLQPVPQQFTGLRRLVRRYRQPFLFRSRRIFVNFRFFAAIFVQDFPVFMQKDVLCLSVGGFNA